MGLTGDLELDQLRRRLEETEKAMERIVAQMVSVPQKAKPSHIKVRLSPIWLHVAFPLFCCVPPADIVICYRTNEYSCSVFIKYTHYHTFYAI